MMSSRTSAQACREHITCMVLAGGRRPDHRTMAALVSSMTEAITSMVGDMRLLGVEQHRCGGTPVSCDGVTRSSNASKAWRGTVAD